MTQTRTQVTRSRRHWLALALLAMLTAGWVVSCNQNEGERCQSQDDCESPLVCNLATGTCSSKNTSGQIDATVPDVPRPTQPSMHSPTRRSMRRRSIPRSTR